MSEFRPDSFEQNYTEARILHDAELIRDGAVINELGRLVITLEQYDRLALREHYDEHVHEWFDTTIKDAFKATDVPKGVQSRCANSLKRDGATTIRHVLIRGSRKIQDLSYFGRTSMNGLRAVLDNDYGIELKQEPTMKDIAAYCRDVSEVDAGFINEKLRPDFTVADILNAESSDIILGMFKSQFDNPHEKTLQAVVGIKSKAIDFERDFTVERETAFSRRG